MRDTMILAGLLACLAAPLVAQEATPSGGPPDSTPDAPPMDKKRVMAARLTGLVGFTNSSCPDLQGDPALLKGAVERLGVDPKDLEQGELAMVARSFSETYQKDVPANCKRAIETFGPSSRIVPNLIVKR
ncbi:hypothetical protein [Methylobacterium sp. WL12]|uniref:hypothetical protein n=1 Tax=Methylobacterium sp. WL12 TaxID=2603890 RepID=UPI001FEE53E4|nr:hypothetical protein [Methylobacterium sp. WL12]